MKLRGSPGLKDTIQSGSKQPSSSFKDSVRSAVKTPHEVIFISNIECYQATRNTFSVTHYKKRPGVRKSEAFKHGNPVASPSHCNKRGESFCLGITFYGYRLRDYSWTCRF
jgi:methionine salvage enolase-phosphatase E1